MLDPAELNAFITVAKCLNFTTAAKELSLSPPSVSKIIAALEDRLRKKLFLRTTRQVRITADGEELLPIAVKALESLRDAEELFHTSSQDSKVSGTIRVTCAHTLASRLLASVVTGFNQKYPDIHIDFILSDAQLNLVDQGIDMAIRVMAPVDSSYIARRLSDMKMVLAASPSYLKSAPRLKTIHDLMNHRLLYIPPHANLCFAKTGRRLGEMGMIPGKTTASGDFLVELAVHGGGVVVRPDWGVRREIKSGELVPITLNDELVSESGIYAVYPVNRYMAKRLRLWIEYLTSSFI